MGEDRPYVLVSCAMSVDGHIDDASPDRLLLSGEADFDRVDEVRAGCDAILVGANTIRRDDPRLLVRSEDRRRARVARGVPPSPTKVTLTTSGDLDPGAAFFTEGTVEKLVYAPHRAAGVLGRDVGGRAVVVDAGPRVDLAWVLADLAGRGVRRLLVEGGTAIHTWFLTTGLVDELHLVVAPFFVGDRRAPRLVGDGEFPWTSNRRMTLVEARPVGDVVLLRYRLPS
ncbi:RibD family protein [Actinoalloteichus caeruleus]|uniref:5-amino-6-(5-phosphoribosylamino)uracil reductase n=1 Tax=Actinoalloteichus caeruleus DSM 43889 TaxID=1120930 RepID=A0ABT1JJ89_ACTCY|nr:dihydrofolate reductase family protein [Actinoalloteichus caeruleus]MCP2332571.1 5-amino-6-(5-phosphoribosylamino)uracil reductase [Actinoalloteichus caeruleus DSM 43889]